VIEEELEAMLAASLGQFLERVARERRSVNDVVTSQLAVKHAEAVVMLARDGDVPNPRGLAGLDPGLRVEVGRVESGGKLFVLADRDLVPVHDERSLAKQRVDPPVDKQAEPSIFKPLPGLGVPGEDRTGSRLRGERVALARKAGDEERQQSLPEDRGSSHGYPPH